MFIDQYYMNNPNELKRYFKIARGPFLAWNGAGRTAINQIYGNGFDIATDVKTLTGAQHGWYFFVASASDLAIQLEDSAIIIFSLSYGQINMIYIDVNGRAKPNQWGRDIFALQRRYINGTYQVLPYGARGTGSAWGAPSTSDACGSTGFGLTCGYEIIKNKNFKPPYKYNYYIYMLQFSNRRSTLCLVGSGAISCSLRLLCTSLIAVH